MVIDPEDTPLMTVGDVARLLHVHINTVRRWSNRGILKSYRVCGRGDRRFKKEDVAQLLIESRSPDYSNKNAAHVDTLSVLQ